MRSEKTSKAMMWLYDEIQRKGVFSQSRFQMRKTNTLRFKTNKYYRHKIKLK